jgi:hypothetical protein
MCRNFCACSVIAFYYEPQVRLAEELASIVPIRGGVRSFFPLQSRLSPTPQQPAKLKTPP